MGVFLSPVFDGKFFPEPPLELIKKKAFAPENLDVIIGHTRDEATWFVGAMDAMSPTKPHFNITFFDFHTSLYMDIKPGTIQRDALELAYFTDHIVSDPDPNYFDATNEVVTDVFAHCPTDLYLRAAAETKLGSVYGYEFTYHPSKSLFSTPWSGATHGDDASFMGACFSSPDFNLTDVEVEMTLKVINYWTNFAKTG